MAKVYSHGEMTMLKGYVPNSMCVICTNYDMKRVF